MTDYKAGERKFDRFLREDHGFKLTKVTDRGLQCDDTGWEHFGWTLLVTSRHTSEVYDFPYRMGTAHTKKPTLVELIASLLSDAGCATEGFLDFCDELGYDSDSKRAEKLFDTIVVNNGRLLRLFGADSLDDVLRRTEHYREEAGL